MEHMVLQVVSPAKGLYFADGAAQPITKDYDERPKVYLSYLSELLDCYLDPFAIPKHPPREG